MSETTQWRKARTEVELYNIIDHNFEGFLDLLVELCWGAGTVATEIDYDIVSANGQTLYMEVSAYIEEDDE